MTGFKRKDNQLKTTSRFYNCFITLNAKIL